MQSGFNLICIRNFVLNNHKIINLDTMWCRKHTGYETFGTMALLLSSDKYKPKTGMILI
jgi:hypothetical protein